MMLRRKALRLRKRDLQNEAGYFRSKRATSLSDSARVFNRSFENNFYPWLTGHDNSLHSHSNISGQLLTCQNL